MRDILEVIYEVPISDGKLQLLYNKSKKTYFIIREKKSRKEVLAWLYDEESAKKLFFAYAHVHILDWLQVR